MHSMKVCIDGASGNLGKYMVQHALDRGYEVVGVCRERSKGKLVAFKRNRKSYNQRPDPIKVAEENRTGKTALARHLADTMGGNANEANLCKKGVSDSEQLTRELKRSFCF